MGLELGSRSGVRSLERRLLKFAAPGDAASGVVT